MLAWRATHPEEYRESLREYARKWRKRHPGYFKKWQIANREYVKLMKRKYRARKKRAGAARS